MTNLAFRLAALNNRDLPFDRRRQVDKLCHFAQVLMEKREFSMALERFDEALVLRKDCAIAWAGRGQALYYQRRYGEASYCLAKASQYLQDKAPLLILEQAKVFCKLGLFEAVVNCCDDILSLSPRTPKARIYRSYAFCQLGCYGQLMPDWFTAPPLLNTMSKSCPLNLRYGNAESVSV